MIAHSEGSKMVASVVEVNCHIVKKELSIIKFGLDLECNFHRLAKSASFRILPCLNLNRSCCYVDATKPTENIFLSSTVAL